MFNCFWETQVDPYLGISDDLHVYAKADADVKEYGSASDNQQAASILFELRSKICESEDVIMDILVQNLTSMTKVIWFINGHQLCELLILSF